MSITTGCNKAQDELFPATGSLQDLRNRERVISFINGAKASTQGIMKDGSNVSLLDAIWDVEAALNFTVGDLNTPYSDTSLDSLSFALDPDASSMTLTSVYSMYNAALAILEPLRTGEQHILLVDVTEPTTEANELKVFYQVASGYDKGAPNSNYGVNSDHLWGSAPYNVQCQCGTNTNTFARCANKEIEYRINIANTIPIGPFEFVSDVEVWHMNRSGTNIPLRRYDIEDPIMAGPLPLGDGYRDTKTFLWKNWSLLGGLCLQEGEMAYFTGSATQGTWSAITTIKALHCPTKHFLSCIIEPATTSPLFPVNSVDYWHRLRFTYGRINGGNG